VVVQRRHEFEVMHSSLVDFVLLSLVLGSHLDKLQFLEDRSVVVLYDELL
jgi:hypothetical protein